MKDKLVQPEDNFMNLLLFPRVLNHIKWGKPNVGYSEGENTGVPIEDTLGRTREWK